METVAVLRTRSKGQNWDVLIDGEVIVSASRDPEHAAARALLARGITGRMTTVDEAGRPHMQLDIETAAKQTVEESDQGGSKIRKWKPFPSGTGRVPARAEPSEAAE